jgi:hypothetical protein
MSDKTTTSAISGAKSSAVPRLDLIPHRALVRLAGRYEKGLARYGRNNWQKGLTELDYVLERAAHVLNHTLILIEKLQGLRPDDGDDDAAAIMWGGAFLCEATFAMKCEQDDIDDARKRITESAATDNTSA